MQGGIVERIIAELTPTNLAPGYSQSTPTRDQPVLIQTQTGGTDRKLFEIIFLKNLFFSKTRIFRIISIIVLLLFNF